MDAIQIFKELIGDRLKPLIISYEPYTDVYKTYTYTHQTQEDFESLFANVLFDSIIFYAYEKDEIEKEYERGHLNNLRKASRAAYELRVPKTEKQADGLMGELTLDNFIKWFFPNIELLYSRVKYLERYPHKEKDLKRKGHEVKGYDGMVFSVDNGRRYVWLGQVKTGEWNYCIEGIKNDINKSLIKYYFSDAMILMSDIMRAVNCNSKQLTQIIDDINDIILENINEREILTNKVIEYFRKENICIRIPCLIMINEPDYNNAEELINKLKKKVSEEFYNFAVDNYDNLNVEVLLALFPVRDLSKLRSEFLEVRRA